MLQHECINMLLTLYLILFSQKIFLSYISMLTNCLNKSIWLFQKMQNFQGVTMLQKQIWMLQCLYTHVSSACFKCFIYFRRMLQMFYLNVSKQIWYCTTPVAGGQRPATTAAVARHGSPCGCPRMVVASAMRVRCNTLKFTLF